VLLAALIGWMYYVISQRPGGQPIGALEWAAAKLVRRIRSLFPATRRRDQPPVLSVAASSRFTPCGSI
jgi:hypothetical protein